MLINYFGPNPDFFATAFFGPSGLNATLIGIPTSTEAVFQQPVTGAITTVTGFGLALDGLGNIVSGTVTGLSFVQGGTLVATMTNINWGAVTLFNALVAADSGNESLLNALFNAAPVTIDASASIVPLTDLRNTFDFTADVTIKGSDFRDTLAGGSGNDTIWFGDGDGSFARGTAGNDTYIFTNAVDEYHSMYYSAGAGGISVNIDGAANTGQIVKSDGVDTLVDIANPLKSGWVDGGFSLYGTSHADSFTISLGAETWMQVAGAEGNDVFNLTMTGWIRLHFNWNGYNTATQALNVNVAAGIVYNDGFGSSDTLNITAGDGVLQFYTTEFADTIVGSNIREDFNLQLGSDTLDGGGGRDRVRYDRHSVDEVNVDLVSGVATGNVNGTSFTHQMTNIEDVRGSYDGDDILKGNGKANKIEGKGGNDAIFGRGGKDELFDGYGNDTVSGGNGNDTFYNGGGSDSFDGGKGVDTFVSGYAGLTGGVNAGFNMKTGFHGDLFSTSGNDTISNIENYTFTGDYNIKVTGDNKRNVVNTDLGSDWVAGNGGNDKITTRGGDDTLLGGNGRDKLSGGSGKDLLKGGAAVDTLEGGKGNDKLIGGGASDVFLFRDGSAQGRDVITDFSDGNDVIRVVGGSGTGFGDVTLTATAGGGNTLVQLSGGTKIVLKGVDISLIDANDFDFV
ncbi:MAG: hypothetical protein KUG74_07010 [Rhodobacteraceae bacterium]|nr:hypothetical protein [Paracoccaceae bacterium]